MYVWPIAVILTLLLTPRLLAQEIHRVCPKVSLTAPEKLTFSKTEKELICDEMGPESWSDKPMSQKKYFLTNFLQTRGYYYPEYTIQEDELFVDSGRQSLIRQVELKTAIEDMDATRYWRVFGRPMTPAALDSLEKWLSQEASRRGYPCIELETKAFPESEIVEISIATGPQKTFVPVRSESVPGVIGGIERRYDAFAPGDTFNSLQLDLTAKRITDDELVMNTTFSSKCEGERLKIHQRMLPGEAKLVTFGIGFDTEEFFIGEASWKNTRFSEMGSMAQAAVRASYRTQEALISFNWYYVPIVTRHYIRSSIRYYRQNEEDYAAATTEARSGPAWNFDAGILNFSLWPSLSVSRTDLERGSGDQATRALAIRLQGLIQSHDFEFYRADPRSGFDLGLESNISSTEFGSDISVATHTIHGTLLKNILNFDPPIWITGLRYQFSTTQVGKGTTSEQVPTNMKHRLGGSADVRGFGRQKIPSDGALTAAYLGAELRITSILPFGIQPIFFVDFGKVGQKERELDKKTYWSPGAGVHWKSPIGTIRGTLAHGFIAGDDEDNEEDKALAHRERWQLYVSLGEQF